MLLNRRIPASYILNKIKLEVLYVLIIGLLVNFLTSEFKDLIPEMPIAIPAFIGTAISVILSLRSINPTTDGGKPGKFGAV
jgi:putative membrane protein